MELDHNACTGCHACIATCPKACISMKVDNLGFLRPVIDNETCVNCGICIQTCKKVKQLPDSSAFREIYAVKHKRAEVKKYSASGGAFTALSDNVLNNGGIIVGAIYSENMSVKHVFAETVAERDKMRGSKYTYSLCDKNIYEKVKQFLSCGKFIMFVGTPCQVAALKTFLNKDYNNLITIDILCHGICAPALYDDFLKSVNIKGRKIININFRYNQDNWHNPKTLIEYDNGKKKKGELENSYFRMFVRDYCLRESCYTCDYASFNRVSDITLGDFWGIENTHKEFDNADGVSVCVINTEKGKRLFDLAKKDFDYIKCNEKDCTHKQLNGLSIHGRNDAFVSDYLNFGYEYVRKKYATNNLSIRLREKFYKIKFIKKFRDVIKRKA